MSDFLFGLPAWLAYAAPFLYLGVVFIVLSWLTSAKRHDERTRRALQEREARARLYGRSF